MAAKAIVPSIQNKKNTMATAIINPGCITWVTQAGWLVYQIFSSLRIEQCQLFALIFASGKLIITIIPEECYAGSN
ncbi:hypothetical protein [Tolumonas osonensis]|uniref:Uncharacterized protein n=1 Tax=Tolumonas osonensis TaxID=675874 RepID=A0A841G5U7_9GAMM|nr:hypothetical protein [Tolumonas osonensis]MBB6054514.1 hypothetical protein [Tolumonas osonensis]